MCPQSLQDMLPQRSFKDSVSRLEGWVSVVLIGFHLPSANLCRCISSRTPELDYVSSRIIDPNDFIFDLASLIDLVISQFPFTKPLHEHQDLLQAARRRLARSTSLASIFRLFKSRVERRSLLADALSAGLSLRHLHTKRL